MFGLLDRDILYMNEAIEQFPEIEKVTIYGSRAMGNYRKTSDVDMAIIGKAVSPHTIRRLADLLNEEYPIPYDFDLIDYQTIKNEQLKVHIDELGKTFYQRKAEDGKIEQGQAPA